MFDRLQRERWLRAVVSWQIKWRERIPPLSHNFRIPPRLQPDEQISDFEPFHIEPADPWTERCPRMSPKTALLLTHSSTALVV
ncbi:hypothetical protein PILCRDRAFT_815262 [Piloderma croceum F 1598]|uniref:Uncharacterized protein n=1 Tax=Piloderma croceum (strain F 1598) TaxID=765440 RepID=A0A0C3G7E3_PILCF|nr:hypothetical protein PILCRDRAFT_815262 [Piloderma croceum F 1598]